MMPPPRRVPTFTEWKRGGKRTPRKAVPSPGHKFKTKGQKGLKYNAEDIRMYKEIFDEYDKDGSGQINKDELRKGLARQDYETTFAGSMFDALDADGSDQVDFGEFLKNLYPYASKPEIEHMLKIVYPEEVPVVIPERTLTDAQKAEIRDIFRVYDQDKTGYLSKTEVLDAFGATGYSDDEIEAMLEKFDIDHDGKMSADEFMEMLKGSYLN